IIDAGPPSFQPMNVNFGLFPPIAAGEAIVGNRLGRKAALSLRAERELDKWLGQHHMRAAE
ncbi:MAG TPA: FADH(2)-oxidizing methylenetetrahydrofolate--tRNA-(uracil(54)-C(5))-methyltransferase TrmFO, partial [Methylocella sp.]|nr:FADH(2)-oxidizing methylenetetrahydrofolate--tRNA-(uracil(54)-C(5))-methyltransferase TrmFO [Methylocella sp.]